MVSSNHACNRDSFVNLDPIIDGIPKGNSYLVTASGQCSISTQDLPKGVEVTSSPARES